METQQPPYQSRSSAGGGGGGKMVTDRRRFRFNPYDRPPPPPPTPKTPNWLSGVVVPASRRIASGAAKIISSVFISDSSSSDEDSSSEEYVNCDDGCDAHPNGTNGLNLEDENSPQWRTGKELGAGVEETGRKHFIKQLILQETFSREECDKLVKIIDSRVLAHSTVDRGKMVDSALIPGSSALNVTPDHAAMEARKFLEEKKAGRSPHTDFGRGSNGLYSAMIQHVESEAGSPADMAKSYMRARLPWASPSKHFELRAHSTLLTQLTSEEKPNSVLKDSVSHLKEKNYLTSGAWNMQDEIRRVRSKATEDMLRSLSSSKVDLSLLSPLSRSSQHYGVTVAICGDRVNALSTSVENKTVDQSAKLAAGANSTRGISASDIREATVIEASLANQATSDAEGKQDLEANQNLSEHSVSDHSVIPESPEYAAEHADTNFSTRNGSKGEEVKTLDLPQRSETEKANRVSSSPASLSIGGIMEEDQGHTIEDNVATSHEKLTTDFHVEFKCELLSEVSIEVPTAFDTVNVENGSRNSHEGLSQGQSETEGKNSDGMGTEQQGKTLNRRYPKRRRKG